MRADASSDRPGDVTIVAHDIAAVGGMERQLTQLVRGLLARGLRVTVVARRCELPAHPSLRLVRVPGPARPFALAYPWFFLAGGLLVARHRRGVLHTTGAIVLNRAELSTVHLCHSGGGGLVARRSRRGLAYRLNGLVARRLSRLGERLVFRPSRTTALVAVSPGLATEVAGAFPQAVVETIPNGVDTQAFRPDLAVRAGARRRLGLDDHQLVALFVGGEWEGKGLELALDAVARSPRWHLLVVGRGDRARYEELARRLGCDARVLFAGEVDDPAPHYAAADAFLLPSAYETFSLALHEAAASALPLVATRVSGVEDVVVHGVNGWFVERDADAIAARLAALEDAELRTRMGAAARAAVTGRDWERMVDGYASLYRRAGAAAAASVGVEAA